MTSIKIHQSESTGTFSSSGPAIVAIHSPATGFVAEFKELQKRIHATARAKGWWDNRDLLQKLAGEHSPELAKFAEATLKASSIALYTSELSEALEGIRHGNPPDDKIPEFTAEEAEYADAIIRIMDTAEADGLRVAEALEAKIAFNDTRSFRHGGKNI